MAHGIAGRMARYAYRIGAQFFNPLRWPSVPVELVEYARALRAFRAMDAARRVPLDVEPVFFNRRIRSPFDAHYTYQAAWATRLIAGMTYVGMWQERCLSLVKELSHEGDLLFVDRLVPLLQPQPDGASIGSMV